MSISSDILGLTNKPLVREQPKPTQAQKKASPPKAAPKKKSSGGGGPARKGWDDWGPLVEQARRSVADRTGVDVPITLLRAMMNQESGGRRDAVSPKGAYGLFQLMPGTAKGLGVYERQKKPGAEGAYWNIWGGITYLANQYKRFGSWDLALAAYNAGPGAVRKYGGIPPYKETRNYVTNIKGMWRRYSNDEAVRPFAPVGLSPSMALTQNRPVRTMGVGDLLNPPSFPEVMRNYRHVPPLPDVEAPPQSAQTPAAPAPPAESPALQLDAQTLLNPPTIEELMKKWQI